MTLGIPTNEEIREEKIGENLNKRKNITFSELGLYKDDELVFLKDKTITCKILDNKNTVLYNNEETTLSTTGRKLLGYNVNGYKMFMSQNETLWDRIIRLENEKEEN